MPVELEASWERLSSSDNAAGTGLPGHRMPLQGKWAILYYGILASVTGGWLPVRAKNVKLTLFHLAFFLAFIFLPFSVFHVSLLMVL